MADGIYPEIAHSRRAAVRWLRCSTVPFVAVIMTALMLGAWANYLADRFDAADYTIKGQSPGIVIPIFALPAVFGLWLVYRRNAPRDPWITFFFVLLMVAWPVHIWLSLMHGDQLAHTVWIYPLILVMLAVKPPSSNSALSVVEWFAWCAALILVVTRVLEMVGAVPIFRMDPATIDWERENYWIPLSHLLGIDGRWPGPFGFNSKTGFIGALIVIISLVRWRPRNAILLLIGAVTLLVTASRGSFLAAACGLAVLATWSRVGIFGRIPVVVRAAVAGVGAALFGYMVLTSPTGLTGRSSWIWPAFIHLWKSSPWIGVGQVGILADPDAGVPMEAHNLYLQELTRFGILGLILQYFPLILGLVLSLVAAFRGRSWPLAVLVSFGVASITEVFMDGWQLPSTYILLLMLAVVATRGIDRKESPPMGLPEEAAASSSG